MADIDFAGMILDVAKEFWGDPSSIVGNKARWGNNGSRVVNIEKGVWQDFESGINGGVIDLLKAEAGVKEQADAMKWLEEHNYIPPLEKKHREERHTAPANDTPPDNHNDGDGAVLKNVAGYTYTDADGNDLYQVVRKQWQLPDGNYRLGKDGQVAKTFRQRRKLPNGEVVWNLDGITHTIYRHPKVEIAIEAGKLIFLPEGEKDADTAVSLGFEASTNSGGAKNWTHELAALFKDADVVILVDNDETGIAAGEAKAKSLKGIAKRIRVLNFAEHVPNFPNKHDLTNWVEAGGCADELSRIVDSLPDWTPSPPVSKFGAVQMSEVAGREVRHDWLVRDIVERHAVFMVAGQSQAGKTFVAIDMGMRIARGEEFAKKKTKQGLVIYQCGEDAEGVLMRVEGFRQDKGIDPNEKIPFVVLTGKLNLTDPESVAAFKQECIAWSEYYDQKIEAVFVDTFKKATIGMEEISGKEVGAVIANLEGVAKECNCTVGVVHHMTKDGAKIRGHSSLYDDMQNVIFVTEMRERPKNRFETPKHIRDINNEKVRKVRLDKIKNGEQRDLFKFVTRKVKVGVDEYGEDITTCVLDNPAKHKEANTKSSDQLSPNHKVIMEALRMATEESGVPTPSGMTVGPSIKKVCPRASFVGAVRRLWEFTAPADNEEARQKELTGVLQRNVTALVSKGYIGRDNDKGVIWTIKSHYDRQPTTQTEEVEPPDELPDDVKRAYGLDPDNPPF